MAFHPNYNNAGQQGHGEFFVFFQTTISGQRYWRLSRFNVSAGDPNVADAGSEQPMITQFDQQWNHNGGDLHFGDDGYLYIATGDEGGANDQYDNGQHIDKDFYSAILRIDVDQRPENLVPNAHAAVHANTYRVPADNPFVGATSFNGSAVAAADVRTEIWAIGLRNPWRMSFDRPTGRLFVADVGQGAREEINIMSQAVFDTNGGIPNYGWSWREGLIAFTNGPGGATPPAGFTHIDPIHDYPRSQGRSVTGGLVYRGSSYPELTSDYLFADYVTGRIWAMDDPGGPSQSVTQIATDNQIAGFGIDPSTGDVLLADDNSNRSEDDQIKRLVRTTGAGTNPPQFLSQTGAFSNLASLTPQAGIVPYGINLPFWSDHAVKTRWFSIPSVSDDMTWAQDANWTFPEGAVWIKHFDLDLDRDNPGANVRRLETRFLVKTADDVYGITYRWNDAQTDAELVGEAGLEEDFDITDGGQTITQTWKYPSRNDCRTCHTSVGGFALGFNTRQMNRDYAMMGLGNQIAELENAGYFTNDPPDPAGLPMFYAADDASASLEDRSRSFLAANCVQCHQPGGPALGNWNARPEIPLASAGIIDGPLVNNGGDPANRVIATGSAANSMIVQRLEAIDGLNGLAPMPPLGSCVKNQGAIDLLTAWIEGPSPPTGVAATDGTLLNEVRVTWNAAVDATSYEVWRHTSDDVNSATQLATGVTATQYSDTSASPGATLFYWLKTVTAGGVSEFSASDSGWRGIAAPGGLALDVSNSAQATVSWNAVAGATNYRVYRGSSNDSAQAVEIGQTSSLSFADNTANPGQLLFWFVRAQIGSNLSGFSADVSGRRIFASPQNPAATQNLPDRIDVTWTQAGGQVGNYEIRRSTTNDFGTATLLTEPAAAATSFGDTSAPRGVPVFYWIRAESATTQGEWTAAIEGFRLTETFAEFTARFGLVGEQAAGDLDPDLDGSTTFEEWAQGSSDPTNSASSPPLITEIRDVSGSDYLTISYLRFQGGAEAGPAYNSSSANYLAQGAIVPGTWNQIPIAVPPPAGLPAPPSGFEWGSFRLPLTTDAADEGFLQLSVAPPAP